MYKRQQEIRYINRDENTHLWLFCNILLELQKEEPDLFTPEKIEEYRSMLRRGVEAVSYTHLPITGEHGTPETGDTAHLILWIGMLAVSLAGVVLVVSMRVLSEKKHRRKRK